MKVKGIFMFKSVQEREKGSFTNKKTGKVIDYDSCYVLVADEVEESGKITERRFKIAKENVDLVNELSVLDPYTKINLVFDISIYSANAKLVPVGFELV